MVDINRIIDDIQEALQIDKDWNDTIKIKKILSGDVSVYANKEQIRQVLNNIINNAVEAMEEGGLLSIGTRVIQTSGKKKYAEIVVSDTGCGIKEEDLNKIFEPFFTKKTRGTGLGLAIVNHLVEGYKGKIEIESTEGKGTRCRLLLPVEKDENL
jgi:signal transduction histidine kinase